MLNEKKKKKMETSEKKKKNGNKRKGKKKCKFWKRQLSKLGCHGNLKGGAHVRATMILKFSHDR